MSESKNQESRNLEADKTEVEKLEIGDENLDEVSAGGVDDPIKGVGVGLGKKPNPGSTIPQTSNNARLG